VVLASIAIPLWLSLQHDLVETGARPCIKPAPDLIRGAAHAFRRHPLPTV
jgi:hypothetical protein